MVKPSSSALLAAQAAAASASAYNSSNSVNNTGTLKQGSIKQHEYRRRPVVITDHIDSSPILSHEPKHLKSLRTPQSPKIPKRHDSDQNVTNNSSTSININTNTNNNTNARQLPDSQSGSTVWNDLNNSSSSTALAAAASIAKNNPSSFVSYNSSPKLVKVNNSNLNHLTNYKNSSLNDNFNTSLDGGNLNQLRKNRTIRKPPPPPRTLSTTTDTSEISIDSNNNVNNVNNNNQHYDNLGTSNMNVNSNISINIETSPNLQQYHSFDSHSIVSNKAPTSASQKLTNFFTPKNIREERERERRNYNHQYSNSTSMLPQHVNQMNLSDSINDSILPSTAPSFIDNHSIYDSTTNLHSHSITNYPNNSNTNIYQQTIPAQQLVFKTTLRNNEKRNGFGRVIKNKHEFNEDKPWKNHDRGNLNIITSDERKRYEGVFAANKNLYLDLDIRLSKENDKDNKDLVLSEFVNTYSDKNERIHGIVVREIWLRSKLDITTLMKIWSLVLDDRKRKWIKYVNSGNIEWLTKEIIIPSISRNGSTEKIIEGDENQSENENENENENELETQDQSENESDCDSDSDIGSDTCSDEDHKDHNESNIPEEHNDSNILQVPTTDINNIKKLKPSNEITFSYDFFETDRELFDDGTLTCEEFIVGMWMIDQCLYGRKMPKYIAASVWETIGVDWSLSNDYDNRQINGNKHKKSKHKIKVKHKHTFNEEIQNPLYHVNGAIPAFNDIVGKGVKIGSDGVKYTKRGVLKKVIRR